MRVRSPFLVFGLLPLVACGPKPGPEGCAEGGSGTLDVHLRDFDASWVTEPGVDVYDAAGQLVGTFAESGTTTLPGGVYTVAVRRGAAAPDTFAGSASGALTDTVAEVCVPDGGTYALDVTAEPQPSGGRLWGYAGSVLAGYTGISDPGAEVQADATLGFDGAIGGVAWDSWGNLWVATAAASGTALQIVEPGSIAGKGDAAVLRTVTSAALEGAQVADLDVDAAGNLWVTVQGRADGFAGVLVYDNATLRAALLGADAAEPAHTWSVTGATAPARLYADADGGLYLSDPGSDAVFHVAAPGADLPADGALTPDASFLATIDPGTGEQALTGPTDMVLDATGLWVMYAEPAILAHVSRSANGTVRSNFTYGLGDLVAPGGLVRDGGNGLWLGHAPEAGAGLLQRVDAAEAALDFETAVPDLAGPVSLAFDPPVPLPE